MKHIKTPKILLMTLVLCTALIFSACGSESAAPTDPTSTTTTTADTGTATSTDGQSPDNTTAPTDSNEPFRFTRDNFPRLNGSTSTVPLGEAVAAVLLGETREQVADLIQFDKTTNAYSALIKGDADLLIVGEPAESTYLEKSKAGFEWEMRAFATDAFIFVVNANNPVDSLTIDQIQRIYTGEITNWSEVGGNDVPILPFQRNEDAGSQSIMKKLVMADLPLMTPPVDHEIGTMSGLMEAVRGFDGSDGAIGYSVYYYAEEMQMAGGLKIIAVEGVAPTPETIRAETYPFLNPKYVVMDSETPANSPIRLLFDWLFSEEGQQLVAHEGYVGTGSDAP